MFWFGSRLRAALLSVFVVLLPVYFKPKHL